MFGGKRYEALESLYGGRRQYISYGKTYISFLELNKNYRTFKYHPEEETKFTLGPQMLGKELYGEHFEKVTRKLDRAQKETLVKNVIKSAGIPVLKR